MVRLKDIALRAGVSVMTVSKVMRDAPDISTATKLRIRTLAQEMGYVPDTMAQGLRNKTTHLLGVVIPASTNPVIARMLLALEERAFEAGFELILCQSLNDPDREEAVIRRLLARRVDGLIISPVYRLEPTAPIYDELSRCLVPTLLLGHRAPFCERFASLEVDHLAGSHTLTQHLLGLGHRRIAFFNGPQATPAAREQLEGYRRALREAQLELDDRFVFNAGTTIEEGEAAARQLLQEHPGATAVQAFNDLVAIGAANAFRHQGWRVPQDMSITGFGNVLTSEIFCVPLTTVHQPKHRLGTAAMEVIQRLMAGEHVEPVRMPVDLVVRQSTAAPRPESLPTGRSARTDEKA